MNKSFLWRGLIILAITLGCLIIALPLSEKLRLGLDLKGGMHLVLEVQTEKAVERNVTQTRDEISRLLRKRQAAPEKITQLDGRSFSVKLSTAAGSEVLKDLMANDYPDFQLQPAAEGWKITISQAAAAEIADRAVEQALEIIRNRVDQFGVAEPDISRSGVDRIVIQLPGLQDPARAKNLIGTTAQLDFKIVKDSASTREELFSKLGDRIPAGFGIYMMDEISADGQVRREAFLLPNEADVSGADLKDAAVGTDQYGAAAVDFEFNARGARTFGQVTERNIGRQLAIVLDDKVKSAPVIKTRITDKGQITGRFTLQEAKDLTVVLRSGALPAPVGILEENTVDPSLGRQVIRSGVRSIMVGGALVILFMIIYYNLSGFLAMVALVLNLLILVGALAYFGATLTLPGIAGIALTVGMAVDANVLIFERIREEIRAGKTVLGAVESAYSKVYWTILDANVTTIIAAACLYRFGTGPIRGFATTLSIGLLANMFTAIFVTRFVFDFFLTQRSVKRLSI